MFRNKAINLPNETNLKNVLNYVRLLSANIRKYLLNKKKNKKMNKKKITEWLQNNINRLEGKENLFNEEFLKELGEIDLNLTKVRFKNILVQFALDNGYKIIFGKKTIENKGNRINVGTFTITPII